MRELICIVCPRGCHLQVDEETLAVTGNTCSRGEEYGKNEIAHPTRTITSTVRCESQVYPRCPVKTSGPIPKERIFDVMAALEPVTLVPPVALGQVVLPNVRGTDRDVVATRAIPAEKEKGDRHE